ARASVLFTIIGGVSAALLVPVFAVWLAYILMRFLDGMSQAVIRKAKGNVETRELYSGLHWNFLRFMAILGRGVGILPENIPPRLLVFANAKYGSVTTVAMTTKGDVVVSYSGVSGDQLLRLETMAELSKLALSTQAQIARNMSEVARNDSRSRMMLSLGMMLAAPIAAIGRHSSTSVLSDGMVGNTQFMLPPNTADNAVSETVRALGNLASKLGLSVKDD
ncbi:MAG: hypothetical protein M1352_00345, partial [Patescibacteria group bacterium]|nr:hypothetical protein [Patescibacteria group bacterium]